MLQLIWSFESINKIQPKAYPPYPQVVHHRAKERNTDTSPEEEERELQICLSMEDNV